MPTVVTEVDPQLPTVTAPTSPAANAFDPAAPPVAELDRQVRAYVESGVAALLDLDEEGLAALVAPLRAVVAQRAAAGDPAAVGEPAAERDDDVPFVLVLPLTDVNDAVPAMRRGAKLGVSVIDREELATYRPVDGVEVPSWGSMFCGDVGPELAPRAPPPDGARRPRAGGRGSGRTAGAARGAWGRF